MPYILENMVSEDIPEVASIERLCFSMPWPTSAYRRELKTPDTNRYIVARFVPPEIAVRLGMPEPNVHNLARLEHSEIYPSANALEQPTASNGNNSGDHGSRPFWTTLLPWLRNNNGHSIPPDYGPAYSPFPVVGYAGLWLMVDEAHVTTIGVQPDHRGRGTGELLFLGLADIAQQMHAFRMTLEVRVSNHGAQTLYKKYGFEYAGVRKRYYSDNGEDAYIMWSEPVNSVEFRARMDRLRAILAERMRRNYRDQPPASRPVDPARLQ